MEVRLGREAGAPTHGEQSCLLRRRVAQEADRQPAENQEIAFDEGPVPAGVADGLDQAAFDEDERSRPFARIGRSLGHRLEDHAPPLEPGRELAPCQDEGRIVLARHREGRVEDATVLLLHAIAGSSRGLTIP